MNIYVRTLPWKLHFFHAHYNLSFIHSFIFFSLNEKRNRNGHQQNKISSFCMRSQNDLLSCTRLHFATSCITVPCKSGLACTIDSGAPKARERAICHTAIWPFVGRTMSCSGPVIMHSAWLLPLLGVWSEVLNGRIVVGHIGYVPIGFYVIVVTLFFRLDNWFFVVVVGKSVLLAAVQYGFFWVFFT